MQGDSESVTTCPKIHNSSPFKTGKMTRTHFENPSDTSEVDFDTDGNKKTTSVSTEDIMKSKEAFIEERKILPLSSTTRLEILNGVILTNDQIHSLTVSSEKAFPILEIGEQKLIYFLREVFNTEHIWGKKFEALAEKFEEKSLNDFHRQFKSVVFKICADLTQTFCYKGKTKINISKL